MANTVQCGYLENIIYDYEQDLLPIDNINNNKFGLFNGLTWKETAKIVKYYNLAVKYGVKSIYHLKLVYTVGEIITKYNKDTDFNNKVGVGAYNRKYYKKYYKLH